LLSDKRNDAIAAGVAAEFFYHVAGSVAANEIGGTQLVTQRY